MDDSQTDNPTIISQASSHRLFQIGLLGLVIACVWLGWATPLENFTQIFIGLTMMILSALPALSWARHGRHWFPSFEIFLLTTINFYAIPLLLENTNLAPFTPQVITESGFIVLAYLASVNLAFAATRGEPAKDPLLTNSMIPPAMHRFIPAGLVINVIYLYFDTFTQLIPYDISGIVRAICFGLATVAVFVLCRLWGAGELTQQQKAFVVIALALQVLLLFSQLYLIRGLSLLILALIGFISKSRRIPWLVIGIGLPIIAILHHGKSDMRRVYWGNTTEMIETPQVGNMPGFFSQWIEFGLHPSGQEEKSGGLAKHLLERASLFQMLCLSVDQVPDSKPYLWGESYMDIPALVVPRALWPNKPSSLQSNVRLGVYLGLINESSAQSVSIAFGLLSEAYINFGLLGAIALGAICGYGFKRFALLSADAPQFSAIGLFMILLTAWSFQAELVLATWLSSLFQSAVITIGLPLGYRTLFNRD